MKSWKSISLGLILLATMIVGCNRSPVPVGFPKLYPCSITITQNGQPLANAQVILHSTTENGCYWPVAGMTDENGVAVIATNAKHRGAPLGEWTVTVYKESSERGDDLVSVFTTVNPDYMKPDTSPLKLTTKKKTNETMDVGEEVRFLILQTPY